MSPGVTFPCAEMRLTYNMPKINTMKCSSSCPSLNVLVICLHAHICLPPLLPMAVPVIPCPLLTPPRARLSAATPAHEPARHEACQVGEGRAVGGHGLEGRASKELCAAGVSNTSCCATAGSPASTLARAQNAGGMLRNRPSRAAREGKNHRCVAYSAAARAAGR